MATALIVQKKTLQKLSTFTNERAAAKPSIFASQYLEKLGWKEGDGLGRERQGMKTHIRVEKKDNNKGIGCNGDKDSEFSNQWWKNGFDAALKNVNITCGNNNESSDSSSDDSDIGEEEKLSLQRDMSTYSEEDRKLFLACGGRRCGKRSGRLQTGKMKREMEADSTFKTFKTVIMETDENVDIKSSFHQVAKQTIVAIVETGKKRKHSEVEKSKKSKKKKSKKEAK